MKKQTKKIVIISLIAVLLIGGIAGVVFGIPAYQTYRSYQSAEQLLQDGQYEEAKNAFWALGEYKDSADKMKECDYQKALQLLKEKKYGEAKELFEQLGDYSDSKSQITSCEYGRAENYLSEKDYESAQTIYEKLGKYKDCKDKIKACQYGTAGEQLSAKNFDKARKIYKDLGEYEDSKKQLKECDYQEALQLVEDENYSDAISLLKGLKNYSNAKKQLKTAQWKKAQTEVISDWTIVRRMCKKKGKYIGQGDDYDYMEEYFTDFSYSYYGVKDLDGDKTPELLLYSSDAHMTAVLTYTSKLEYVSTFYAASLNKDNNIVEEGHYHGAADNWDYYLEVYPFSKGKIEDMKTGYTMTDSITDYMAPEDFDDYEEDYDDDDDDYYSEPTIYYYIYEKEVKGLSILDSDSSRYKIEESSFKKHYENLLDNSEDFSGMCNTSLGDSETIKNYK